MDVDLELVVSPHRLTHCPRFLLSFQMVVVTSSLPPPTEGVRVEQPSTAAHMGSRALGSGTLYIAESRVAWAGTDGQGFSLEYPHIMLHAVSRDTSAFPHPCLYLMVDAKIGPESDGEREVVDEAGWRGKWGDSKCADVLSLVVISSLTGLCFVVV